ncbi:hypothetical protein E5163_04635 [Marinicauda algicola]|uniref:Cyclic di-GMP-binding protein n=1 Tax=Marinicauda algicola TaxID=2029849 RepID=A0A4S2H438_9PROT|nr:hypothetical protein [Marinicauda algicola]TGY90410.1 hypothetical protein E5163_04635 [Marinicauda algicola]
MKTNKEYQSRFPWFSASLGIIAVISVATLFVSGQLNAGRGDFGRLVTDVFERFTSAQAADQTLQLVTLESVGERDGLVVSGFPAYASTTLPLVQDQTAEAVRLVLTGEQDVSERSTIALRLTVNGRRIMERVLAPGRREFTWVFDLTEDVVDAPDAHIALQLLGDLPADLCHNDRSMGAVIALAPDSGLEIDLARPLTSLRDALALMPRDVRIAMADGPEWFEMAARLGARLNRDGYRIEMIDIASAPEAALDASRGLILLAPPETLTRTGFAAMRERAEAGASLWQRGAGSYVALTDPERFETIRFLTSELLSIARTDQINPVVFDAAGRRADLVPVSEFGVDTTIQNVAEGREWRMDYTLAEMPDGLLPSAVYLDLRLPEGPDGFTNLAHVELNGELIDSRRLQSGESNVFSAALPAQRQALSNRLAVVLQRHRDEGGCEITQRRYPVQLSEESGLVVADGAGAAGFTALPRAFSGGVIVRIPELIGPAERLVAARITAETIAHFVPQDASIAFETAATENGESGPVDRPFIAINNAPANAAAPLRIIADRLVVDSATPGGRADVRALSNLTVLQGVAASVPDPRDPGRTVAVPGLMVHAIDEAPAIGAAALARQRVAIVHANGEVIFPDPGPVPALPASLESGRR